MTYPPPPPFMASIKLPAGLTLSEGEKPIWYSHPSYASRIGGIIGDAFWLAIGLILFAISPATLGFFFGFLLIIIGIIGLVLVFIGVYFTEFFISNRRVYIKTGVFGRSTHDLRTEWITGSTLHQGVFGRMFDYGNVIFNGVGFSNAGMMGAPNVQTVKSIVDNVVQVNKKRVEVEDKLKRLQEEFDYGRISEAKYRELKLNYEAEKGQY
jgi:uncharacterized membrane protein YdbT with pleckstrin-like domain